MTTEEVVQYYRQRGQEALEEINRLKSQNGEKTGGLAECKYSVYIQYDADDEIFVACIPEFPGCMAHGKTREDSLREICVAERLWLECAREEGKEIPQPVLLSDTGRKEGMADESSAGITLTVDEIHKLREANYERTKDMTSEEVSEFFHSKAAYAIERINKAKK